MGAWVGLVPPLVAALFAGWCGNLLGGVTAGGSETALASLLLMPVVFGVPWRDPLRLGRTWRLAPVGLWIAAAASAWLSPVPRAGLEAVVLLPAYLCLPGAFAGCWKTVDARRLGARGMAAAVALLAAWALFAQRGGGEAGPGASVAPGGAWEGPVHRAGATLAPLGHHTLLATWLVTLLPLALLTLREKTAWRWLGAAAGALGIAGVLAGRSLAGGAGLACEALAAALWLASRAAAAPSPAPSREGGAGIGSPGTGRRARRLAAALAVLGLALAASQLPRVARIAAGEDPSALARAVYIRAAWNGWQERPWLGWGPGSAPWTAAWFLVPRPGLNPWGEAVGELHSLPVHLAYETGALGLLGALITGGAFLARRWRERRGASDAGLLAAGCLGLAGAAAAWTGTAAIAVPALPLALAAAAGAALAGAAQAGVAKAGVAQAGVAQAGVAQAGVALAGAVQAGGVAQAGVAQAGVAQAVAVQAGLAEAGSFGAGPGQDKPPRRLARPAGAPPLRLSRAAGIYGLAAATALLAPEMARWHYDRAVAASQAGRQSAAWSELAAAVRLDPRFPLYRMRLALLPAGGGPGPGAAALALSAARDARGVGLLWLVAGILGRADGEVWAPAALEQGCALDPLSPFPPFYLMASAPDAPGAPRLGARALLAEPRLLAATFWEGREPLFRQALEEVRRWPGLNAGWKLALLRAAPGPDARRGAIVRQELIIDAGVFTQATSLHLFRRLPWLARWQLVRLRQDLLARLDIPPATALRSTEGALTVSRDCGPGVDH